MKNNNSKNEMIILHEIAMEFVHEAEQAYKKGDFRMAKSFYKKAFSIEKKYANAIPNEPRYQLTRSVVFKGAVTLAINSGYWQEAEQLAQLALNNNPHPAMEDELKKLLQKTTKETLQQTSSNSTIIIGILIGADVPNLTLKVLNAENNQYYGVLTTEQKIDKIVKSFWKKQVEIKGTTDQNGAISLEKIKQIS